ncbi:MAG: multicopper oxidase domain-containing protein, partial [Verrucomicrobiota bacterium]|nr:multicopper oxidase domain-containing protein [Verrucomicrobiota bacterium]
MTGRILSILALFLPVVASAATVGVNVGQGGSSFSPSAVSIQAGDSVKWTWVGNNHSVTSGPANNPNGLFDSNNHNTGYTFTYTFPATGSYPYYCRVHGAMMTGTVTVTAATPTPTPTATPSPTVTPTPTATPTPTPTPVPTPTPTPTPEPFTTHALVVPPTATAADIPISIGEACVSILDGPCTYLWTYGGTYPGLTIRRPTGQSTRVTFTNNLPPLAREMTVHHHGNHSTPEDDGYVTGPSFLIGTGASRTYTFDGLEDGGNERGTMQFYHDHRMGETGLNVWMGLEGLYIIDDPADPASLPSGAYDLPMVIADRQFGADNQLQYFYDPAGVVGDKVLINGVYQPYLNVADRKYRIRFLNGANARIYTLTLGNGDAFTQIGTESGLLPAPVARTAMEFGPAERLDVVVDFAGKLGQEIYLVDAYANTPLLKFRVTQHVTDTSVIPSTLRPLPLVGQPTVTRQFSFDYTSGHWTINGQQFDPNRTDAHPVLGATERWIFTNPTGSTHLVHIHDVDQQCVSRNGGPCRPYETMKETWSVASGETLELKMRFTDHLGLYMLHCHILEHEDDGMMTQFEVVAPIAPVRIVSRKTHAAAGTFDIDLPLTGTPGIECRTGGAANSYQLVFTFAAPISFSGASVTSGTGAVSSSSGSGTNTVMVNLTGVANAQRLAVM